MTRTPGASDEASGGPRCISLSTQTSGATARCSSGGAPATPPAAAAACSCISRWPRSAATRCASTKSWWWASSCGGSGAGQRATSARQAGRQAGRQGGGGREMGRPWVGAAAHKPRGASWPAARRERGARRAGQRRRAGVRLRWHRVRHVPQKRTAPGKGGRVNMNQTVDNDEHTRLIQDDVGVPCERQAEALGPQGWLHRIDHVVCGEEARSRGWSGEGWWKDSRPAVGGRTAGLRWVEESRLAGRAAGGHTGGMQGRRARPRMPRPAHPRWPSRCAPAAGGPPVLTGGSGAGARCCRRGEGCPPPPPAGRAGVPPSLHPGAACAAWRRRTRALHGPEEGGARRGRAAGRRTGRCAGAGPGGGGEW